MSGLNGYLRGNGKDSEKAGRKTYYNIISTIMNSNVQLDIKTFRCLYRWCPPLPIPNREVKPTRADGTAVTRGRVGRCQILKKAFQETERLFWFTGFFVYSYTVFFLCHHFKKLISAKFSGILAKYMR
jgi:hypothetical protein